MPLRITAVSDGKNFFPAFDVNEDVIAAVRLQEQNGVFHPWLLYSSNRGLDWTSSEIPFDPIFSFVQKYFDNVYIVDDHQIIVAGDSGLLYISTDRGATWEDRSTHTVGGFSAIDFDKQGRGVVAFGGGEQVRTTDFGLTWEQLLNMPFENYTSVRQLSDGSAAFIVYGTGEVFLSRAGSVVSKGSVLGPDRSKWNALYSQFEWLSDSTVLAVGWRSTTSDAMGPHMSSIMRSDDQGATWYPEFEKSTEVFGLFYISTDRSGASIASNHGDKFLRRTSSTVNWELDSLLLPVGSGLDAWNMQMLDSETVILNVSNPFQSGYLATFSLRSIAEREEDIEGPAIARIFPNPAKREVSVETNFSTDGPIYFVDILGRTQFEYPSSGEPGVNRITLPSSVASGVLQVVITRDGKRVQLGKLTVY